MDSLEVPRRIETEAPIKVIRNTNPLIEPLGKRSENIARFDQIVNATLDQFNVQARVTTALEPNSDLGNNDAAHVRFSYKGLDDKKVENIRALAKSMGPNRNLVNRLYFDLQPGSWGLAHLIRRAIAPKLTYYFGTTNYSSPKGNPSRKDGIFLTGERQLPLDGSWKVQLAKMLTLPPEHGTFEYHSTGKLSEVEAAYLITIGAMIMENKIDLTDKNAAEANLKIQREIFVGIYQNMLRDMMPIPKRDEVFDLDVQIEDIRTNLYSPLERGDGHPMNALMVGAPGVGKSFAGHFLAGSKKVLTVPISIDMFRQETNDKKTFETEVLPILIRTRDRLGLPIVNLVDDVEGLFEQAISKDASGHGDSQSVDVNARSRNLNLLERMTDTYGIYLLCSLNHPDIESAFLRRFNPVYFPLPTDEQRKEFLGQIVPAGPLSNEDVAIIQNDLAKQTTGFNYNAMALIPRYLKNLLDEDPNKAKDSASYAEALKMALAKARETSDIGGLANFDMQARAMVSRYKKPMGFDLTAVKR